MVRWFLAALLLQVMQFTGLVNYALNPGAGAPIHDGGVAVCDDGNGDPPPPNGR